LYFGVQHHTDTRLAIPSVLCSQCAANVFPRIETCVECQLASAASGCFGFVSFLAMMRHSAVIQNTWLETSERIYLIGILFFIGATMFCIIIIIIIIITGNCNRCSPIFLKKVFIAVTVYTK
jgi:hypothetical protein